jgi:hypothetical protein
MVQHGKCSITCRNSALNFALDVYNDSSTVVILAVEKKILDSYLTRLLTVDRVCDDSPKESPKLPIIPIVAVRPASPEFSPHILTLYLLDNVLIRIRILKIKQKHLILLLNYLLVKINLVAFMIVVEMVNVNPQHR